MKPNSSEKSAPIEAPVTSALWLVRLGPVFAPWGADIWDSLAVTRVQDVAPEYFLLTFSTPVSLAAHPESALLRWMLPVQHQWPTPITRTEQFVEKAAQALAAKFAELNPQNAFGTAARQDVPLKRLASNLRGRLLQVLAKPDAAPYPLEPESQDPHKPTLFFFLHAKGLLAGVTSPADVKSLQAGGTRYVNQQSEDAVSRAGAKLVEGLWSLRLCALEKNTIKAGAHWLELGASPGGMTQELLSRGLRVTAVDRATLAPKILTNKSLTFHQGDVATFKPVRGPTYEAMLCDMNGDWELAFTQLARLAPSLVPGAPLLFTLKFGGIDSLAMLQDSLMKLHERAAAAALKVRFVTHSTYNRLELSVVLQKLT